jgi:gamma-glutamylcyclotransferase (GGCT)/AIG2-like uncharacterized protein YtfP
MPIHLFVYGTLHPDRAPAEIADIARRLEFVSAGTLRGRLYDLGDYPGLILDDAPEAPTISGEIFAVPDGDTLAAIDAYEQFRPADPPNSLFDRTHAVVTLPDGSQQSCWVYVYNRDIGDNPSAV